MSIRELALGGGGKIEIIDDQNIDSSMTWTKDPLWLPSDVIELGMWGGGGGGAKYFASRDIIEGGDGAPFNLYRSLLADIPSSVPVVIGAGGVGGSGATTDLLTGGDGGITRFHIYSAIGGRGGALWTDDQNYNLQITPRRAGYFNNVAASERFQTGQLLSASNNATAYNSAATYAGGKGASAYGITSFQTGGTSLVGGAGGSYTANTNGGSQPGAVPGGGGAAAWTGQPAGGPGGAGRVRVRILRGVTAL